MREHVKAVKETVKHEKMERDAAYGKKAGAVAKEDAANTCLAASLCACCCCLMSD